MTLFKTFAVLVCAWSVSAVACADSITSLSLFLKNARSMRADFVQSVTTPVKENRPAKTKTSSGSFAFVRPTVFRFDYAKPFVQNIIADGQHLWLYDAQLDILDAFGTRSLMKFERTEINPKNLTQAQFNFVPPKGADLIKP